MQDYFQKGRREENVFKVHHATHLAWLEPFWILLLGAFITLPGKFIPLSYHPYLLAGLFLFWPLRWIAYGRLSRRTPLDWSIALLLLWLPVNLWASADRTTSWIAAGYFLFGLTLYTALVNWPSAQRKPQLAAWLLLLIGGGLAIASPPLTAWKPRFRLFDLPLYNRLQSLPIDLGETIHANILAGALVIVLPIFVSLAIKKRGTQINADKRRWTQVALRLLFCVMALVVGGVIMLTQSRGGYLALAVALPLVFVLRWPRLLYGVPVLVVVAMLAINRAGLGVVLDQLSSDGTLGGWAGRIDIWTQSLNALHDFVFTGIGIGTFTLVLPLLYPLRVSIEGYPHAHNLFLQIGVDLGLPGLIAYLALLINLFVMLWGALRSTRSPSPTDGDASLHWALAVGALGGLVAMLIHGLLDAATWGNKLAFIPWVLFALITLIHQKTSKTLPLVEINRNSSPEETSSSTARGI